MYIIQTKKNSHPTVVHLLPLTLPAAMSGLFCGFTANSLPAEALLAAQNDLAFGLLLGRLLPCGKSVPGTVTAEPWLL